MQLIKIALTKKRVGLSLCWLGSILLCNLFNPSFAASEWEQVTSTQEYAIYMSAKRIKPVISSVYINIKPTQVEAWGKTSHYL